MGIDVRAFKAEFPDGNPFANQVTRNVVRLSDVLLDAIGLRLRRYGLNVASAQALAVLEGADEPLTPNALMEHLHLTSGTVTTLIDSLERRHLVARGPHPDDRRKVLVSITDDGRALVNEYLPETVAVQSALLAGLKQSELTTLNALIEKGLASANGVDVDAVADAAAPRFGGRRP